MSLDKNSEGISAWKLGKKTEKGEWIYVTATGYFDDVNKVKVYNNKPNQSGAQERQLQFAMKYKKTDAGYQVVMNNESRANMTDGIPGATPPGADPQDPQAQAMGKAMMASMKPMLQGMKMQMSVTVPGKITKITGFMESKDRTASVTIDSDMIFAAMEDPKSPLAKKMEAMSKNQEGKVVWESHSVSDAQISAFKKEMAAAKEKWKTTLAEAKKKASQK